MARIPGADLERLKKEIAVQRLVETSGVVLKKIGKNFTGICPSSLARYTQAKAEPTDRLQTCNL
jgi:DNA primase